VETIWQLVERRAAEEPDAVLLVDERGVELTNEGLRARAERVAAAVAADHGVRPGTRVAWIRPTWIDAAVFACALSRLGAVQIPIVPIWREREIGFITTESRAELIVVPGTWRAVDYAAMAERAGTAPVVTYERDALPERAPIGGGAGPVAAAALPPAPTDPEECRWVFYTSGTTADPKGARHGDRSVLCAGRGLAHNTGYGRGDIAATTTPFTHIGGMTLLSAALWSGVTLLMLDAFDPVRSVDLFLERQVPYVCGPAIVGLALVERARTLGDGFRYPGLRAFCTGGGPTPPSVVAGLAELRPGGVPILRSYGLTESPIVTADVAPTGTEGPPTPEGEVRIAPDGEVQVRGNQLFLGYMDPALDTHALTDDGWFHTGDLGRLDDGNLVITGRLKAVVIRKGETISLLEVENTLSTHPAIAEVTVIGLPDDRSGERICAIVVPRDPAAPPTLASLAGHCREQGLAAQKFPEQLEVVDAIPRNAMGKAQASALQQRFAATR
jgi:acyl-CoA synthetase (AMP-forming)/AMP-acid ligase II